MRRCSLEDIPTIVELKQLCFMDEIERGLEFLTPSHYQRLVEREDIFILGNEDHTGKIIAFILVEGQSKENPAQIHIMGVHPDYQRNGFGSQLIEAALELAREHEWIKVKLHTRPWNQPMRKIMAKFEFIPEAYLRKEFLKEDIIVYSYFR